MKSFAQQPGEELAVSDLSRSFCLLLLVVVCFVAAAVLAGRLSSQGHYESRDRLKVINRYFSGVMR